MNSLYLVDTDRTTQTALPPSPMAVADGRQLDLNNPDPTLIRVGDIATGLAFQPRYIGHGQSGAQPYSQAMQALWIAQYLMMRCDDPILVLQGMLRDGYKAYIGDIPKPTAIALWCGTQLQALEARVQAAIYRALEVPALTPEGAQIIEEAKAQARRIEVEQLMPGVLKDWDLPELDYTAKTLGYLQPIEPWIAALAFEGYCKNLKARGSLS